MLVVESIAKIRRAYFSLGNPKFVRKVIRSNAIEFHYERSRQPLPRIGPWRERLEFSATALKSAIAFAGV